MFICTKINFFFYFFLEMLQTFCKLVILSTSGETGHTHQYWYYQLSERFVYLHAKNQLHVSLLSWDITKYCKELLFWVLWACLIMATKSDGICFKESLMLLFKQKIKFMSYLFLAKILQLCYFGYFKHPWPPTPNQQYLLVENFDVYLHFFLRYYTLKNSQYDWPRAFWPTTWEKNFSQIGVFSEIHEYVSF